MAPVAADPPDVSYSDSFAGSDDDPWDSSWDLLPSDPSVLPYIDSNQGEFDSESGDSLFALRPETMSDMVQQVEVDWNGQIRRSWGLAMRFDATGSDGYLCVLSNDSGEYPYYHPELTLWRSSGGWWVPIASSGSLSISTDQELKCEATGTTIRAKMWAAGTSEPGTWNVSATDPAYATGQGGIFLYASDNRKLAVDDYALDGYSSSAVDPPDPGGGAWFVEDFAGDPGDPWPNEWTHTSSDPSEDDPYLYGGAGFLDGNDHYVLSTLGSSYTDSDQVARVIWSPEEDSYWSIASRFSSNDFDGYMCALTVVDWVNNGAPTLMISRFNNGYETVLDEIQVSPTTDQWLKCVADGSTIQAKTWDVGTTEPGSWDIEVSDGTYSSGLVGVSLGGDETVGFQEYRLGPWPSSTLTQPDLVYSTSDDRSDPATLDQATVDNDIYVFASPPDDTTEVEFWIDDPTMAGSSDRLDDTAPFDLIGGSGSSADPWDTVAPSEGTHTVTAVATLSDSSQVTLDATITVDNIPTTDLVVSSQADRSSPTALDGETLSGDAYVFVDPDDSRISQVSFYVDDPTMAGLAYSIDTSSPWDLEGGTSSTANPFDTTALTEGSHTITAHFELTTGADLTITSTFEIDNLPDLDILLSSSADRSSPGLLNGSTLAGDAYVFVGPDDPTIAEVEFWIDDPQMTGPSFRLDDTSPWDLVGGDSSTADPLDTTTLTEGSHSLTAVVDLDGTPTTYNASFTVDNLPDTGYTLTGTVFEDAYGNGVIDEGSDSGLYGIVVEVYASDGTTLLGSASTDFGGAYNITDLPGGTVIVRIDETTVPSDVILTSAAEQTVVVDGAPDEANVALAPETLGAMRDFPLPMIVGYVDTHAGDGSNATVDGSATSASFQDMGGITIDEGLLYVSTAGALRYTDAYAGTTRTLAGDPTATGCVDSDTPADVRFGTLADVATDGVYIYSADPGCNGGAIRKTSISDGSTSTLVELNGVTDLVVAEDGYLYAASSSNLYRVDRKDASASLVTSATTGFTAVSADSTYLWIADGTNVVTVDLSDDTTTTVANVGAPITALESTGDHVYLMTGSAGTRLVQLEKATATLVDVAGSSTSGYQDGAGIDALFDGAAGLTSDGIGTLFVADSNNHRIRSVRSDTFQPVNGDHFGNDGYGAWSGGANSGLGNYVTDHTDFAIATAGPNLGLTRTYNSLDPFSGPFGVGWRFDYEMTWRKTAEGDVVILYPDGRRETHTQDGQGGYTPPEGYFSTLEDDGNGGFTLETKDGTTRAFNSDGELTSIEDSNGRALILAYTDGKLDSVTDDVSGRLLDFTWTDDRITEVATNSVAAHGGPVAWTYGYDGDGRLVKACDPRDNDPDTGICWHYEYNENDQLTKIIKPEGNIEAQIEYGACQCQSAAAAVFVLNPTSAVAADDPVSLWRLDESSGDFNDSGSAGVTLPANSTNVYLADGPGDYDAVQTGFSGSGLAEITAPSALQITGDLTIEAWVKIEEDTQFPARIVRLGENGEWNQEYSLEVANDGTLRFWSDGTGYPDPFADINPDVVIYPGVWHHVAAVRSHGNTRYSLYVDGRLVHTEETAPIATGQMDLFSIGGGWINDGNYRNTIGAFANVAVFDKALSAERIRAHYFDLLVPSDPEKAWRITDGEGNQRYFDFLSDSTVAYDARGYSVRQYYDESFRLVQERDQAGNFTTYAYDNDGNRNSITDANNNTSILTYDSRRNITSQTNGENETTYFAYDSDDNLTERRDGRSASSSDDTYLTAYTYDSARNRLSETDALGNQTTWEYSDGTEAAIGGGTIPAGLLIEEVSPRGNETGATPADFATTFEYDSAGDLRRVTEPSGLVTEFDHDELGRLTSETVTDSAAGITATTTHTYDEAGNLLTETQPSFSDALSSETHQMKTTNVYDDNSNLVTSTRSDLSGDDSDRTTTFSYDLNDRELTVTDPESGVLTRVFDENGNVVSVTDQEGREVETAYDERNLPASVTAIDFVDDPIAGSTPRDLVISELTYDDAGRKLTETDAEGRVTEFAYDQADRLTDITRADHVDADSTVRDVVLSHRLYDNAGNLILETVGDDTANYATTTYSFDDAGRPDGSTVDPLGLDRETSMTLDANGNPEVITVTEASRTETTTLTYDPSDRVISTTVENGTDDLTTTFDYDERGNRVEVVDARGNASGATATDYTTTSTHDVLNRLVEIEAPAVDVDGGPSTDNPTMRYGYDTFGNRTHTEDANGNVTVSVFDGLDRLVEVHHPSYTPPGESALTPVEYFEYDAVGNLVARTSRRGFDTDFTFDNLNRVVAQEDPLLTGESSRGVTRFEYDDVGNRTAVVDQRGARTEWTYDSLDRVRTRTDVIRVSGSSDILAVSTFGHDDLGNRNYAEDPEGGVVTSVYNTASELTSVVDQVSETTSFVYELGRLIKTTDPLGRYVESDFDLAGRLTESREYDSSDTLLATTQYDYDETGNRTSATSPRGFDSGEDAADHTITYTFDAVNRLLSVSQPANDTETISTAYGYDLAGNLTEITDGEANTTTLSYNTWNLVEDVVEPSTTAYTNLSDRTWTTSYDAGGLPVAEDQPGGVSITRTYDELGRLTAESGSGDGTATRSLSYDLAGLLTGVGHPSGTIGYTYDDRGLLTDVTGPAGTATYTYDTAGRMTERDDTAGTATFTWTDRHELDTLVDPTTGTTLDYTWDAASQLTEVAYGTSGAVRTYTYDDRGRLTTDTLEDDTPTTVFEVEYGYDTDSNLTSKDITVSGNNDAGLHSYEYDYADRLVSWTDPGSTTVDYTWDLAGNRTDAGSNTFTFDERNRLTSGPEGDYTYTARGTLDTIDTTRTYDFDPFGRLTTAESISYTYDSLDRVATRGSDTFQYSDAGYDPVTDANQTYARTPGGHLISITDDTTDLLAGVDRHGDLTHLYDPDGTITDTSLYDPFGDPRDTTGSFGPTVGYQSDWTDPTTTHVYQGARWYQPAWATFLSRDTVMGELTTPVTLNRYTYANNSPLNYWDPYGLEGFDLRYGSDDCAINYACAPTPTPAQTTGPTTPPTSSDAADEALRIVAARSTADTYGLTSGADPYRFANALACASPSGCGTFTTEKGALSAWGGIADSFLGVLQSGLDLLATGFNTVTKSTTSLVYADMAIRGHQTPDAPTWTPPNITVGPQPGHEGEYFGGTIIGLAAQMGLASTISGARTSLTGPVASVADDGTRAAIGFAKGEGASALTAERLQHGTRYLTEAGVLPAWRGSTSPQLIRDTLSPVLETPIATFDNTLGGTAVKGFVGMVNGQTVAVQVFAEGPLAGQLATSVVPSASQLTKWGVVLPP